ncbi:MAG: hypothetical protein QXU72_06160 [Thermofilum sp.]
MVMLRRGRDEGGGKPKDFFEEHEKLRAEKSRATGGISAHDPQPSLQSSALPSASPALPYASSPLRTADLPLDRHVDAGELASANTGGSSAKSGDPRYSGLDALISSLRSLGYEVKPLEALREYAAQLDGEAAKLSREIEEKRKRLELLQQARELLRRFGI